MPARTGAQYLQGLNGRPREVWISGERIKDVTAYPGFRNGARSIAALYLMQHDPTLRDEMTYTSPTTGDRVGLSFITPKDTEDLERRRQMMYRWITAFAGMTDRWSSAHPAPETLPPELNPGVERTNINLPSGNRYLTGLYCTPTIPEGVLLS